MKNYRNLIVLIVTAFALLFAMSCSAEMQDMRIRDTAVGPAESVLDGYSARNPFNGTDWRVLQKLALAEFTEMAPLMGYDNGETLDPLPYPVLDREGKVNERRYVDYRITCDERIADGHAYAVGLKYVSSIFKHPEVLDTPPEKVMEDIH